MPPPPASPVYRNAAALVVGVGDYTDAAISKLPCPAQDAKALHEALIDPDVCRFDPDKVLLLTESQATAEAIREAMKVRLPKISAGAELVIIYFSGHGDRDRIGETVEGYLLPVGARRSDIEGTGIAMSRIQTYIDALKADTVLVMLDCCHAAHYLTRDPNPNGGAVPKAIGIGPTLMPEMKGGGRFLIASCDKDERSLEIPHLKRGLFTHHLIEGMRGGAARNAEGQIGINSLFDHVARRVADESKRIYGEQQTPRCKGDHTGDAVISHPPLPQPAVGPKRAPDPWDELWNRLGADAFSDEVSRRLDSEGESSLRRLIRFAARRKDPRFVPLLLGLRDHRDKATRDLASRALNRLGWDAIRGAVLNPPNARRPGDFERILAGLNKYEPDDDLLDLIREVNRTLPADLRVRGIRLLERKRLERDRDRIQAIFREHKRPLLFKQVLGAGLFAGAYLIEHEETKAQLTLRVLRSEFVDLPDVPRRFMEVAGRAMGLEDHQNLVSTTECQAFEGHRIYFVVRKFIDGLTLQKLIEGGHQFSTLQVVQILKQVCEGLSVPERQAVADGKPFPHGGVKPSNVFLRGKDRVVLGDFATEHRLTGMDLDRMVYDYRYVAPEAFLHAPQTTVSDFYSMGCVGYELLVGEAPVVGHTAFEVAANHLSQQIRPQGARWDALPVPVRDLILRLLSKSPADRPATCEELTDLLDDLIRMLKTGGMPPAAPGPGSAGGPRASNLADVVGLSVPRQELYNLGAVDHALPRPKPKPPSVPAAKEADFASQETPNPDEPVAVPAEHRPVSLSPGTLIGHREAANFESHFTRAGVPDAEADQLSQVGNTVGQTNIGAEPLSIQKRDQLPSIPGYNCVRMLGRGGMGAVYEAVETSLDRPVAIKTVFGHSGPDGLARFFAEARVLAQLNHPNIVQIYQIGETSDGMPFIAMELCTGSSLSERLRQELIPMPQAIGLAIEIAGAAAYAHSAGIIHRDIKPGNILFDRSGAVKLLDFGLGKMLDQGDSNHTRTGAIMGTPAYMSPEQASGQSERIGPSSDVWSIGVTLYEILTGSRPFVGAHPFEIMSAVCSRDPIRPSQKIPVPRDLEAICMKCLQKDPADRYPSANELVADLQRFRDGTAITARPLGRLARLSKWFRRRFRRS